MCVCVSRSFIQVTISIEKRVGGENILIKLKAGICVLIQERKSECGREREKADLASAIAGSKTETGGKRDHITFDVCHQS